MRRLKQKAFGCVLLGRDLAGAVLASPEVDKLDARVLFRVLFAVF